MFTPFSVLYVFFCFRVRSIFGTDETAFANGWRVQSTKGAVTDYKTTRQGTPVDAGSLNIRRRSTRRT